MLCAARLPAKALTVTLGLTLALVLGAVQASAAGSPSARHVIVFGVDGLVPDYYHQADRHGLKIPALRALMGRGSYAKGVEGVWPTVTFPSNATLVTGARPARHGVISNTPFDPKNENQGGWYWYSQDLRAKTLWDAAGEKGLVTATLDWPVTAGARVDYNIPEIWRAGNAEDAKLVRLLSTPGLVEEIEARFGRIPTPYFSTDAERGPVAAYVVEKKRPHLAFVYFSDLDTVQHEHGPYTPEAFSTLEMIDGEIARVIEATRAAGIYEETVFAVTSDHGFERVEKRVNPQALLRFLGFIQTDDRGRVTEWKASMYGAAVMLQDENDVETLNRLRKIFATLGEFPESGIARIYEKEEIERLGGYPGASLLLEPRDGFSIGGPPDGNFVSEVRRGGTHGLPPHFASMKASFILTGPGVRRGVVLEECRMIDVAPTLAYLLDLELPEAEGRVLEELLED